MKTVNHVPAHLSTMCPVYTRRQKKVTKEKATPLPASPALRSGQPAVLGSAGVELELATLKQSLALIRLDLRSSAQSEGVGDENGSGVGSGTDADAGRPDARSASGRGTRPSRLHASAAHAAK